MNGEKFSVRQHCIGGQLERLSRVGTEVLRHRALRKLGWRVLRIWQHELARRNEPALLRRLEKAGVIARKFPSRKA